MIRTFVRFQVLTLALAVQETEFSLATEFRWDPKLNDNWARRIPIEPVAKSLDNFFRVPSGTERDAYALVTQCDSGDMEWVEGPYECSEPCGDRDQSCFNDGWGGFQCAGSPRKVFKLYLIENFHIIWTICDWLVTIKLRKRL